MHLPNRNKKPRGLQLKTTGLMNFSDYKKKRYVFSYGALIALLIIFIFIALVPFIWLFISSFKTPAELGSSEYHLFPAKWDFTVFIDIWQKCGLTDIFINTLVVVIGGVICAVIFNSLLAYAIAILKPVGYKVVDKLVLLAYMIPSALAIYPLMLAIMNSGITNFSPYLPLCLVFGANAYYYMLFKNYFEKLPASLIEAARIDGLSNLKIFFKVVVPLAKPIIGVVAIFAMTAAYSDYLLPYLIVGTKSSEYWTLMVAIFNFSSDVEVAPYLLQLLVLSIKKGILLSHKYLYLLFSKNKL